MGLVQWKARSDLIGPPKFEFSDLYWGRQRGGKWVCKREMEAERDRKKDRLSKNETERPEKRQFE